MKLARYRLQGRTHIGVVDDDVIAHVTGRVDGIDGDMKTLIASWGDLRAAVERVRGAHDATATEVTFLAPVSRPGKVWGIGLNYADHIAESGIATPEHQTWFAMAPTTIAGPSQPIELPIVSRALDYEAELVFIVGAGGRHIQVVDADKAIFGYCCGNDVSVRDWQMRTGQFSIGKSFDTHAPLGPWIVTSDEINPDALDIRCFVNNEMRQASNTRHLIFKPAEQLAHLSQAMTMEPGDVVFTGTPGGVGAALKPPQYLQADDCVRVEIDGIGSIENIVVDQRATYR